MENTNCTFQGTKHDLTVSPTNIGGIDCKTARIFRKSRRRKWRKEGEKRSERLALLTCEARVLCTRISRQQFAP